VLSAREIHAGPQQAWAPDLTIEWRDSAYMPTESERDRDRVFVTRWREYMRWPTTGAHRPHGLLIAAGPGVRPGAEAPVARGIDLAPTWLAMLGQPVPPELPGRVLREILVAPEPDAHGARPAASGGG
jgi:hypothetical protein